MRKKIKEYKKTRVCGNIFQRTWNRFKTCLASVTGFPASRKCFTFRGNIMSNWNGLGLGENRFLVKKNNSYVVDNFSYLAETVMWGK